MEEAKTIKVSPKVYAELNAFTGLLSERLSDFAGAWVMSDEEEEEIKKSLKELWETWKMD